MAYLRSKLTGAITDDLEPMGTEYQILADLRDPAATNHTLWEDVPHQAAEASASRVLVLYDPGSALALTDFVEGVPKVVQFAGTITAAAFVPLATMLGDPTNNRTITVIQDVISGVGAATRAANTLLTLALTAAGNNATAMQSKAMAINTAAFTANNRITVVSTHAGTGIIDPGGLAVITYTRA